MCETRNFVEMERNEGDRGLLNSWGNFRSREGFKEAGKVESQRLSEGKGSKRAKHRVNLENCQVVARN